MKKIHPIELTLPPFKLLDKTWALLVSGKNPSNLMTVSWGGFGTLWNQPMVTVYVRPTRFTFQLLNQHPEFSLNFLSEKYRKALEVCGTLSGRSLNKWEKTGLRMEKSKTISVPRVKEAFLSLECKLMAFQDFDPQRFVQKEVETNYPKKDYHRIFWAEPLAIWAENSSIKQFYK